MDADTAETIGGVVRFLCRAAQRVWEPVDAEGGGSPQHVLALGIDLAADEAHDLLADALQIGGPVPVGDEPGQSPRSAEQLLRSVGTPGGWIELYVLRARVADLVWKANTGVAG